MTDMGTSTSFPRSAWECLPGRSASLQSLDWYEAERRQRHSHAERGNEGFPTGYRLPTTDYRLPTTDYRIFIPAHKMPGCRMVIPLRAIFRVSTLGANSKAVARSIFSATTS